MRAQVALFAAPCLFTYVSVADTVDIKGYVYYQDYHEPYTYTFNSQSAPGFLAFPIDGAIVSLYKRTSSSSWIQYGSSIQTDEGCYVFEDIDVGRDATDLCTYSDWFRVEINATGCLPENWYFMEDIFRFSHNTTRPSGIPDDGDIRVDCVFESSPWVEYDGSSLQADGMQGHWIADDYGTAFSLTRASGEATCPVDSNPISCGSCIAGHFNNRVCCDDWAEEEGSFRHVFWPISGDEYDAFEPYYGYWSPDWPNYAMHVSEANGDLLILVNFIEPNSLLLV